MEAQRAKAEARPSPRRNPLRPLLGRRGKTVGLPWRVVSDCSTSNNNGTGVYGSREGSQQIGVITLFSCSRSIDLVLDDSPSIKLLNSTKSPLLSYISNLALRPKISHMPSFQFFVVAR